MGLKAYLNIDAISTALRYIEEVKRGAEPISHFIKKTKIRALEIRRRHCKSLVISLS